MAVRRKQGERVQGLSVAKLLLLVALIPVVGLTFLSVRDFRDAQEIEQAALDAEALATTAVELARLDAAIFNETVLRISKQAVADVGVPVEMLEETFGSDFDAQLTAAQQETDAAARVAGRPEVIESFGPARAGEYDFFEIFAIWEDSKSTVRDRVDEQVGSIADVVADSPGEEALLDEVAYLGLVLDMQQVTSEAFFTFYTVILDVRDPPAVEVLRLAQLRTRETEILEELEAKTGLSESASAALASATENPDVLRYRQITLDLIERLVNEGAPPAGRPLTLETVIALREELAIVGEPLTVTADAGAVLFDDATDRVFAAVENVKVDAQRQIRQTYIVGGLLILGSVLVALIAARFIVNPLQGLRRLAEALKADVPVTGDSPRFGPVEVRAASDALADAAGHFALVTQQANALARNDLSDDIFDETAGGGIGAALTHAVRNVRDALAGQEKLQRQLSYEASTDGLTRLPNRKTSLENLASAVARAKRSGTDVAVLFIDLDRFKEVNDRFGHQAGDTVLKAVAERLGETVREGDHVGRLGGDEFVVFAEPISGVTEAVQLGERVIEALCLPVPYGAEFLSVGASVGIAMVGDTDLTADELMRDADMAVYRAKAAGRGGVEVCDEDLRASIAETADLTTALRSALDNGEFVLHYQPIIDTATDGTHALEALIRWQRPGFDELWYPDAFVPFAERSSMIVDIDNWVLAAVLRQLEDWSHDPVHSQTSIAVNMSGRHLQEDGFVSDVLDALGESSVDPSRLIIEVTETAMLHDLDVVSEKLHQIRSTGVRVSIDDFGTGYTSLAHLRSLPIDILKIDRSFAVGAERNAEDASIVKLIIDTGHLLGAVITVEGVETGSSADQLRAMGSDTLQGYYFARPGPLSRRFLSSSGQVAES